MLMILHDIILVESLYLILIDPWLRWDHEKNHRNVDVNVDGDVDVDVYDPTNPHVHILMLIHVHLLLYDMNHVYVQIV